jgi:hypothetical protein
VPTDAIAYAVMEKGALLSSRNTASLADSTASNAWPMSGYTYFVLRTQTHIGTCARRQAALLYLAWFYTSSTSLSDGASTFGFTALPGTMPHIRELRLVPAADFLLEIVRSKLISSTYCRDSTSPALSYLLDQNIGMLGTTIMTQVRCDEQYCKQALPVLIRAQVMQSYFTTYTVKNAYLSWNYTIYSDSSAALSTFRLG